MIFDIESHLMNENTIIKIRAQAGKIRIQQTELQKQQAQIAATLRELEAELLDLETTERVLQRLGVADDHGVVKPSIQIAATGALRKKITKREQILTGAAELLQAGIQTTDQLLDDLELKGVEITGSDRKTKLRNLSAYLSRAKDELGLESSRLGWSLITQKGESPVTAGLSGATMSPKDEQ